MKIIGRITDCNRRGYSPVGQFYVGGLCSFLYYRPVSFDIKMAILAKLLAL